MVKLSELKVNDKINIVSLTRLIEEKKLGGDTSVVG